MELLADIPVKKTNHSRIDEVNWNELSFGGCVTDHMLVADYKQGAWQDARIIPYSPLSVDPATLALHYGQTVFEGMKAFRMQDDQVSIFRVDKHYARFVRSLERMCMAVPPKEIFTAGLSKLVSLDNAWVPRSAGASLYLRPFVYASEARFGVKVSDEYKFIAFGGPVPDLFAKPIRVKVETNFSRASRGGTGFAKCGGNYGGAFLPTQQARTEGYDQVLWTDAAQNRFIEESGMMNILFVINGNLVTPALSDSILDGVTRDSLLVLAKEMGYKVEQRPVAVDELVAAFKNQEITEAFGAGTAAVVAPIQTIHIKGTDYQLPTYTKNSIHQQLKQALQAIRTGASLDLYGWNEIV